jgi:hypothetical protein
MSEINTIYPLDVLLEYREKINRYAAELANENVVYNDSVVHASLIMQCFFNNSENTVNMYCGKFSIFRERFKQKLINTFKDPIYGPDFTQTEDFEKFDPYGNCIKSLISFFERGGVLNVITDDDVTPIKSEPVWSDLEPFVNREDPKLAFYRRNDSLLNNLFHYAVADDRMYRSENCDIQKTAICSFNNKEESEALNNLFLLMKEKAIPANL